MIKNKENNRLFNLVNFSHYVFIYSANKNQNQYNSIGNI